MIERIEDLREEKKELLWFIQSSKDAIKKYKELKMHDHLQEEIDKYNKNLLKLHNLEKEIHEFIPWEHDNYCKFKNIKNECDANKERISKIKIMMQDANLQLNDIDDVEIKEDSITFISKDTRFTILNKNQQNIYTQTRAFYDVICIDYPNTQIKIYIKHEGELKKYMAYSIQNDGYLMSWRADTYKELYERLLLHERITSRAIKNYIDDTKQDNRYYEEIIERKEKYELSKLNELEDYEEKAKIYVNSGIGAYYDKIKQTIKEEEYKDIICYDNSLRDIPIIEPQEKEEQEHCAKEILLYEFDEELQEYVNVRF